MPTGRGQTLGKYELIAEIARGGMGIVYLAAAQGPGGFTKLVVVKELKPDFAEEPTFLTMFLDEARLAARLSHPNIVQTNEVGNDGDRYFMAMDYLDGRGLDRVRRRTRSTGRGLSRSLELRVICEVLAGLEYAHTLADFDGTPLDIVHRDVSPQNVFITFDGQVKLLDFGIAKARDSMHETHAGVLKGKIAYMAPEQARGQRVDARADVFSAGVLLWEALAGRRIGEGKNDQEILWALASRDLPRVSTVRPEVPRELDELCARAMAWDRDARYPSAAALREDLEAYLARTAPITARDLAACVSELFAEDRAKTSALIEQHLARARGGATSAEVPVLETGSLRGHTPSNESATSGASGAAVPAPSPAPAPSYAAWQPAPSDASGGPAPAPPAPRRGSRAAAIVVSAAAVLGVAAAAIIATSGGSPGSGDRPRAADPAATAAAAPSAPGAAAPAPAPAPARPAAASAPTAVAALAEIAVVVTPASAGVTIDGAEMTGNPARARFPADGATRTVRASAPGHQPKVKAVTFDRDVLLELTLEPTPRAPAARPVARAPRPAPRAAPPPPPAEPAPVRPAEAPSARGPTRPDDDDPAARARPRPIDATLDVNPAGGQRPRRPIDTTNPYGAE
jgi:serine/threonine-protein kinase